MTADERTADHARVPRRPAASQPRRRARDRGYINGRKLRLGALLAAPVGWLAIAYLGSLFILLLNAFWAKDSFTGRVEPFNWSLAAFETILTNPVYGSSRCARSTMALLVTITDALMAIPIAYYMARVASPRKRGLLVVAVLVPLWAAYLVKVYSWRIILQGNGLVDAALAPFGLTGPGLSDIGTRGSC